MECARLSAVVREGAERCELMAEQPGAWERRHPFSPAADKTIIVDVIISGRIRNLHIRDQRCVTRAFDCGGEPAERLRQRAFPLFNPAIVMTVFIRRVAITVVIDIDIRGPRETVAGRRADRASDVGTSWALIWLVDKRTEPDARGRRPRHRHRSCVL